MKTYQFLNPKGYEQITSLSSAAALTPVENSSMAMIQAEGQDIRYRDDGTNPTASVGMILKSGETLIYHGKLTAFKAIQVASGAKLNVSYYE